MVRNLSKTKKKIQRLRYCNRCNQEFNPTSKYSFICDSCNMNYHKITNENVISLSKFNLDKPVKIVNKTKK